MLNDNISDVFGPREINFSEIGLNSLGRFVSGLIGSIVIFILTFLSSSIIDVPGTLNKARVGLNTNSIFPFMLSIIAFISSSITIFSTYFFLTRTDSSKYKSLSISYGQLAFFITLTYIFITPIYIYAGVQNYDNIIYVFLGHIILLSFGTHLIAEILNNYRYVLIGIYGTFIGLFLTIFGSIIIFLHSSNGFAKLITLLIILPIINTLIIFFKQLFELIYYKYYQYTGIDRLGDIFSQLKNEEEAEFRESEALNN